MIESSKNRQTSLNTNVDDSEKSIDSSGSEVNKKIPGYVTADLQSYR